MQHIVKSIVTHPKIKIKKDQSVTHLTMYDSIKGGIVYRYLSAVLHVDMSL